MKHQHKDPSLRKILTWIIVGIALVFIFHAIWHIIVALAFILFVKMSYSESKGRGSHD